MPKFYDTHAHLDGQPFASDLPQVIERARAAGIEKINCIATDVETSRAAIAIAEQFPNVFASVGWHPSYVMDAPDDIRPALRELAEHPKVVALGETGLDYFRLPGKKKDVTPDEKKLLLEEDERIKAKQAAIFRQHLEVAIETSLPVVVHERETIADLLVQIEPFTPKVRAVFHCFAGDIPSMQRVLAMGCLVSFTGILTFKNGQNMRDTLAATPMGKFMLETDSPYLAPIPHRGKRCEPAFVKEIAETAAQVKKCTLDELSAATEETARNFFRRA